MHVIVGGIINVCWFFFSISSFIRQTLATDEHIPKYFLIDTNRSRRFPPAASSCSSAAIFSSCLVRCACARRCCSSSASTIFSSRWICCCLFSNVANSSWISSAFAAICLLTWKRKDGMNLVTLPMVEEIQTSMHLGSPQRDWTNPIYCSTRSHVKTGGTMNINNISKNKGQK